MPFSLESLSDRAEIEDLLVREAHALDKGDWDAWEEAFTPNADIDYSENDGAQGDPAKIRTGLAETFATFPAAQHLTSNTEIALDGDRGTARHGTARHGTARHGTARHGTARSMRYIGVDRVYHGKKLVVISGIWFHDELTRTSAGWRIHKRHEELAWRHSFPEEFVPPVPAG